MPPKKAPAIPDDAFREVARLAGQGDTAREMRAILRPWTRATDARKRRFRDAFREFQTREENIRLLTVAVANAIRQADRAENRTAPPHTPTSADWRVAIAARDEAVEEQQHLIEGQRPFIAALWELQAAATEISGADATISTYLADRHGNAQRDLTTMQNNLTNMERQADYPLLPGREDLVPKVPEDWVPSGRREEHDKARATTFREAPVVDRPVRDGPVPPIDPDQWEGCWTIRGGGHGKTGLWFRFNDSDDITDRLLRKDTIRHPASWDSITAWDHPNGDVRNGAEREPMEVACHHDLEAIGSTRMGEHVNVPHLRGWMVDNDEFRYSLLLDWCGYGDLGQLIERYRDLPAKTPIPEPFLWRVFLSLAVTALAMEKGHVRRDANPEVEESWEQIIHRDLKPQNIFLDKPSRDHFKTYPTPRVGDFGVAVKTWVGDVLNPAILVDGQGTKGYQAPEQTAYVDLRDGKPVDRFKQLAHTNVFGVGMIMFALIAQQRGFDENFWLGEGQDSQLDPWSDQFAAFTGEYSDTIKGMIQSCVVYDPSDRPTFEMLLDGIQQAFSENLINGRKHGIAKDRDVADDLTCPKDVYATAMTKDELPDKSSEEE